MDESVSVRSPHGVSQFYQQFKLSAIYRFLNCLWRYTLGGLLKYLFIGIIRLYQVTISPMLGNVCRYYPTCSHYGLGAIRRHGPLKGSLLAAWRILRCHPWAAGGVDPVPEIGSWRNSKVIELSTNNDG